MLAETLSVTCMPAHDLAGRAWPIIIFASDVRVHLGSALVDRSSDRWTLMTAMLSQESKLVYHKPSTSLLVFTCQSA
jgi:hypothetical protein